MLYIFCAWNVLWSYHVKFSRLERALVLLCYIFLSMERALVLFCYIFCAWNALWRYCVIFFCMRNALWYYCVILSACRTRSVIIVLYLPLCGTRSGVIVLYFLRVECALALLCYISPHEERALVFCVKFISRCNILTLIFSHFFNFFGLLEKLLLNVGGKIPKLLHCFCRPLHWSKYVFCRVWLY